MKVTGDNGLGNILKIVFKSILFYAILYSLIYFGVGKILRCNDLVYTQYFKLFSILIISIGIAIRNYANCKEKH